MAPIHCPKAHASRDRHPATVQYEVLTMRRFRERRQARSLFIPTLALLCVAVWSACGVEPKPVERLQVSGGDAGRGKQAIQNYSCGSCHQIGGVPNARGLVGPPLNGIGSRRVIAGYLPNQPENMERWLQYPQDVAPGNAMPDMGVTDQDARDIAAYLYTLK